jgi:oligoendopeptidase F
MSSAAPALEPPKIRWDLSAFFSDLDDPRLSQTWDEVMLAADRLNARYRGKIESDDLTAETLVAVLTEVEALSQTADKAPLYANLRFAVESDNAKVGAFMAEQMERYSALRVKLMFVELELQSAKTETIERLLASESLAKFRHFIERTRVYAPHRLSESEEVLLEETANTGTRAWVRLFEEVTANHVYTYREPGSDEDEELSQEEVLSLLRDADRAVRQAAADSFSKGLGEQARVLTFIYNNLLADKKVDDRLRKFTAPETSRHLANELEATTVDLVEDTCVRNYGLVARYYRVKREILGLDELTHVDRYAPLDEAEGEIPYDEAKDLVLRSFREFSPELADRTEEFFTKNWIDAEPRPGKTSGAFCSFNTPDTHPVVMLSYLNKMKDVATLAHELGHGAHASLSREQSYFNFHGTLPLAELASIFGEMLVFDKLVAAASPSDQLALYADKIEGTFATVFRQIAMYRFEKRSHQHRREVGELSTDEFGDIWQAELQAMFGDSVRLGDQHRVWWSYVSHFIGSPFYVYAYAFGELLTLSLYQKAKREGPEFADRYLQVLRLGGSKTPHELMEIVGVDLNSPEFWQGGIDAIELMIGRFEELWAAR